MTRATYFSLVILLCAAHGLSAEPAAGTPVSPSPQVIAQLIKQLGSPRFAEREAASTRLVELGRAAKVALWQSRNDPDPEIAIRCQTLLPQAVSADLKQRIDAFISDSEGKQKHDIPGWKRFQEIVGSDPESKKVFIDMLKTSSDLFEIFELNPQDGPGHFARRCNEIIIGISNGTPVRVRGNSQNLNATDMNTIFFFGSDPETAKAVPNKGMLGNLLWQQGFQTTIKQKDTPQGKIMRKLFFSWVKENQEPQLLNQVLAIINQMELREGLEIAEDTARNKAHFNYVRAQALIAIGKIGEKEKHEKFLREMLDDETLVTTFNNGQANATTQLRDIALAMLIHLHKQEPKEFGFEFVTHSSLKFAYYYLGFATDEKRAEARKKWDAWVAKQPKK